MITQVEIEQLQKQIDEHYAAGDMDSLFAVAKKLYSATDNQYGYFLGTCYLNGWGTQSSPASAIPFLHKAADNNDNYNYACYLCAIANYRCNNFKNAFDWFVKAREAGMTDSLALFADSAAGCAFAKWDEVRVQFAQSSVTQGAEVVKYYMSTAIENYMKAAEEEPDSMNSSLFCGYAKLMILMYNMGTTGMLDMDVVAYDSIGGIVSGGLQALGKMLDTQAHDKVLFNCVIGAQFIEKHGYPLIAEYLRAYLAVLESIRDKSANAFYRAKWHMERIYELFKYEKEVELVKSVFADINTHYIKAENRYGATVTSMMRNGQLPDLTKSFLPEMAPAADSSEFFMTLYNKTRNAAQKTTTSQSSNGGLGGFLKNLFK